MRSKRRPTITYRLHAQRAMLMPSIMLRRGYLEKVHLAQIRSEKDDILSHIGRLQPGVLDEFLQDKRRARVAKDFMAAQDAQRKRGDATEDELSTQMKLHLRGIQKDIYNSDRLHQHVEYLQTRDAALTDRIPTKAVGL